MRTFLAILVAILFASVSPAVQEDPNSIVSRADLVRAPNGSYEYEVIVKSYEGIESKSENSYRVYVKDMDRVLVEFLSPASEKGKSLLMLGDDLWIYLPNVRKPIRISSQERLVGEVSNGDLTRMKFAEDYQATLVGEEVIDNQPSFVLDLAAKSPEKTYNKIRYWVSKSDYRPIKAEYFSVSGRSLKICTLSDYKPIAGAIRPHQFIYQDSVNQNKKSVQIFQRMVEKRFDDKMFAKEYMKNLE